MAHVGQELALGEIGGLGGFLGLAQDLLDAPALRNVHESNNRADYFSAPVQGMRPVFGGKAGAVAAPEDFVFNVGALSAAEGFVDVALLHRVSRSILPGMVHQGVHVLAMQVLILPIT